MALQNVTYGEQAEQFSGPLQVGALTELGGLWGAGASRVESTSRPYRRHLANRTPRGAESTLVESLRRGDERAFRTLVNRLHDSLVQAAVHYVRCPVAAEDVVQETWVGFLLSVDRFEGRCSVKTWLFRILFNKAKSRAAQDQRLVPFSSLIRKECEGAEASVDPSQFNENPERGPLGHWNRSASHHRPEALRVLEEKETLAAVKDAISKLPPAQGTVMLMRDVEGMTSTEVCSALKITATNQRVLLHRARTKVRRALTAGSFSRNSR